MEFIFEEGFCSKCGKGFVEGEQVCFKSDKQGMLTSHHAICPATEE